MLHIKDFPNLFDNPAVHSVEINLERDVRQARTLRGAHTFGHVAEMH